MRRTIVQLCFWLLAIGNARGGFLGLDISVPSATSTVFTGSTNVSTGTLTAGPYTLTVSFCVLGFCPGSNVFFQPNLYEGQVRVEATITCNKQSNCDAIDIFLDASGSGFTSTLGGLNFEAEINGMVSGTASGFLSFCVIETGSPACQAPTP